MTEDFHDKIASPQFYFYFLNDSMTRLTLKGLGIIASDSKQNPGFSSCCNHNYKPLGQSGIPSRLQADRLSDYQDMYDWTSKFQKPFS